MRTIEKKMVEAVKTRKNLKLDNTKVYVDSYNVMVFLYGHNIYKESLTTGEKTYSCCGYDTALTRSRLNALGCPCRIFKGRLIVEDDSINFKRGLI